MKLGRTSALFNPAALNAARRSSTLRMGIVLVTHFVNIRYAWWRVSETLPAFGWNVATLFAYGLLGLELVLIYIVLTGIEFPKNYLTRPSLVPYFVHDVQRTPLVDQQLDWWAGMPPRIDVFIPSFNEPWEVIEKTAVGASSQNYPNYHVWILDDGRRGWLREQADALGIGYITRSDNSHYKAGNINHALRELRQRGIALKFIALLDADFIPRPEFLRRSLALMLDRGVGLVQTPQRFYNPDPFQRIFGIANWPEDQRWWFDVDEPSLDASSSALCCGTACLLRVEALDAIGGGFPTQSVTEDTLCSIRLKDAGWQTVYLAEPLAVGLAAEGLAEWFAQRVRWLRGELQNRRLAGIPKGRYDRLNFWLSFLQLSIWSAKDLAWTFALIAFWTVGYWPLQRASPMEAVAHFVPLWLPPVLWSWVSRGRRNYLVTTAPLKLLRFVWLQVPLFSAFSQRLWRFDVTAKAHQRDRTVVHWRALRLHALIAATLLLSMLSSLVLPGAPARASDWFWCNLVVTAYLLAEAMATIAPTIEPPHRRRSDRYASTEPVRIAARGITMEVEARDISIHGARLFAPHARAIPSEAILEISDVGLIPSRLVRRCGDGEVVFQWDTPLHRPALIRKLYCSSKYVSLPDQWRWRDGLLAFLKWSARMAAVPGRRAQVVLRRGAQWPRRVRTSPKADASQNGPRLTDHS